MTKQDLETMVANHNLSFAYLSAKIDALSSLAIGLAETLPTKQANQLMLVYYKAFYDHLRFNTSKTEDGEFDSKLHELHQMSCHYQRLVDKN